jgi:hypothetical protein
MRTSHPKILLFPVQSNPADRSKVFREYFEACHDKAVSELMDGNRTLDSHKLAAIAIIAVVKTHPIREYRDGVLRDDNFVNETLALLLAHDIMLVVRRRDYTLKNPEGCAAIVDHTLARAPFSGNIFDELTPLHRLRLIIAHMDLDEEHFLQNVRI